MSYSKLGLLLGDPSGIGPELCAKLLEERSGRESNRVVLIGEPSPVSYTHLTLPTTPYV